MKNKTLKPLFVFSLFVCVLLAGCKKQESKKITFVLDWTPNTNHTGLYVAQEKGYFAEEGLSVDIVQPSEDGATMMVASGRAQFGVGFQDSIAPSLLNDEKLPVTAVAALLQHNTSGLISLKKAGIDRPKNLEGKKYATWESPIELATIRKLVEDDALSAPDFHLDSELSVLIDGGFVVILKFAGKHVLNLDRDAESFF